VTLHKARVSAGLILAAAFVLALIPQLSVSSFRAGEWTLSSTFQSSNGGSGVSVTNSGSGSGNIFVSADGTISGGGTFQDTEVVTISGVCSGGGTFYVTEQDQYSGVVNSTGWAYVTITSVTSNAPATATVTCPNPSGPPITESVTLPGNAVSGGGTYLFQLSTEPYSQDFPFTGGDFSFTISPSSLAPTSTTTKTGTSTSATTTSRTTTTSSSTSSTTATSTTESCHMVNPSEHIDICVPDWLSGSSTGSANVVSLDGSISPYKGILLPGSGLATDVNSYVTFTDPDSQATISLGPLSKMLSWTQAFLDPVQASIGSCADSPETCTEITAYHISQATKDALESAFEGNLVMAWYKFGNGVYDATVDVTKGITKAACLNAGNAAACDSHGSNILLSVWDNGTEFDVMDGTWIVVNLISGDSTTISTGQGIFVSSDPSQAAVQNMGESVKPFDTSSVSPWWETNFSTSPLNLPSWINMENEGILMVASAVVLLVVSFPLARRRGQPA